MINSFNSGIKPTNYLSTRYNHKTSDSVKKKKTYWKTNPGILIYETVLEEHIPLLHPQGAHG